MTHGRIGRRENVALFTAALLAAIGGLIYELILGTAASYLLGDSVLSFSLATGITLFGMGIGSLLVNRFRTAPAVVFGVSEVLLGLIGGNSVLLLYLAFGRTRLHWVVFGGISLTIGILIGLEIPLLVRTFAAFGRRSTSELLGKVMAIDYFGSLVASLVFPLVLLHSSGSCAGPTWSGRSTSWSRCSSCSRCARLARSCGRPPPPLWRWSACSWPPTALSAVWRH